ncbi:MAG TPA: signal peptidase I [Solirubrobacteraceae bacterium]|nr:signal peptidase I [Solirubrobacteraceae bacterium]
MILKTLSRGNSIVEFVLIVLIALALAFCIQAFVVKPYRIPSQSMVPTLIIGQRVLVDRLGNDFEDPHIGEIVVFHPPEGAVNQDPTCGAPVTPTQICPTPTPQEASVNFIKRVVAGPGDTISVQGGHVILNGKLQKEPFTAPCAGGTGCDLPTPIKVPAGHWFMMGDNRGQSDDSRFWGPIPKKWIIGDAFATYWPISRIGGL